MRLTEKQVIEFEQAEKAQQLLDEGKVTLGEFETMVQQADAKKEITVTLTEQSHKHAEIQIHAIANPDLVLFVNTGPGLAWFKMSAHVWCAYYKYSLCHPDHEKECLHWLNGGDVLILSNSHGVMFRNPETLKSSSIKWSKDYLFMNPDIEIRIKQEPEYVRIESIFDLNMGEQYYCNSTGKSYDQIGQYPSEQYLVAQLENNNLYRKVEQGE